MYIGLEVKYSLSCQILKKAEFLDRFTKNPQISSFMEIRFVGSEFFHAEEQTQEQAGRQDEAVDLS